MKNNQKKPNVLSSIIFGILLFLWVSVFMYGLKFFIDIFLVVSIFVFFQLHSSLLLYLLFIILSLFSFLGPLLIFFFIFLFFEKLLLKAFSFYGDEVLKKINILLPILIIIMSYLLDIYYFSAFRGAIFNAIGATSYSVYILYISYFFTLFIYFTFSKLTDKVFVFIKKFFKK